MHEGFTDRARKAMELADQCAHRHNHMYVGTEHILVGLIEEGGGVAANLLKKHGLDFRRVLLELERCAQPRADKVSKGKLPKTDRAQKVIDYATEESHNLKHRYLGTEHVLLGLLRVQEGIAAQVLMELGLNLEQLRREVVLLGERSNASNE